MAKKKVRIPGIKVLSALGKGGQGVVYKALHVPSGKEAAVKFLHPGLSKNREFRGRFLRETETALERIRKGKAPLEPAASERRGRSSRFGSGRPGARNGTGSGLWSRWFRLLGRFLGIKEIPCA